jgi:hypothetical protein
MAQLDEQRETEQSELHPRRHQQHHDYLVRRHGKSPGLRFRLGTAAPA